MCFASRTVSVTDSGTTLSHSCCVPKFAAAYFTGVLFPSTHVDGLAKHTNGMLLMDGTHGISADPEIRRKEDGHIRCMIWHLQVMVVLPTLLSWSAAHFGGQRGKRVSQRLCCELPV